MKSQLKQIFMEAIECETQAIVWPDYGSKTGKDFVVFITRNPLMFLSYQIRCIFSTIHIAIPLSIMDYPRPNIIIFYSASSLSIILNHAPLLFYQKP